MVADGLFTLSYPDGQYRTVRIRTATEEGWAKGKVILYLPVEKSASPYKWTGIAFLEESANYESGIRVRFWKSFRTANPAERLRRIQVAVDRIARDPAAAGLAFAMKEGCCCKCGRELTVPASLHCGMGPECAGVGHWTKKDQVAAYQAELRRKQEGAA